MFLFFEIIWGVKGYNNYVQVARPIQIMVHYKTT